MNFFGKVARNIVDSIADAGEKFLDLKRTRHVSANELINLCNDLLSLKGVASGIALAREVVSRYQVLNEAEKLSFFKQLNTDFSPDMDEIRQHAVVYSDHPNQLNLDALNKAMKSTRQELFTRMNMAPEGTKAIVSLREDLLSFLPGNPELRPVDQDLQVLLTSWFNPGFLILTRIDWDTEASVLEKIIRYEAVHNIVNWDDLKQRLVAARRCFAYFHPALEDEPLIFVEVALTKGVIGSIQAITSSRDELADDADTAIFYSINNCQKGLRRIPLGNFLIKRVATELARELPALKRYVTLSPLPGFAEWLIKELNTRPGKYFSRSDAETLQILRDDTWYQDDEEKDKVRKPLMRACATYLLKARQNGKPLNAVSRFHFGNGAELYRINWMGNTSRYGLEESFGLMVNYLYDLKDVESNHEAYVKEGKLSAAKSIRNLVYEVS